MAHLICRLVSVQTDEVGKFVGSPMAVQEYRNKIFKIEEVRESLGLAGILQSNRLIVTYNQLMKNSTAPRYLFIFDETGPEIPSLILYCSHFGVRLLKIGLDEIVEIQKTVKHARLIGIPRELDLLEGFEAKIESASKSNVQIDILKLRHLKI